MPLPLWPKLTLKQMRLLASPPIVQRVFSGINRQDAFSIKDTFATEVSNLTTSKYPSISVREGYTQLGLFGAKVLGIGVWKNTELHAVFSDGTWRKYVSGTWTTIATGLNASAPFYFTNFQGSFPDIVLIGSNGVDVIKYYSGGSSATNLPTAPSGGNLIEQFSSRIWCVTSGNQLNFSGFRQANNWTTTNGTDADPGFLTVESPDGETINCIKSGLSNMTIVKPSSIYKLFGYVPNDYQVITVTREIGTFNNNCVINILGVMYILDRGGLYEYTGATLPDKSFSVAIQPYINSINPLATATCSLGTNGRKLYISIPVGSATSPDTIIEYDPLYKVWFVWKDFSPNCFGKIGNNMIVGDNSGRVMQFGGVPTDNGTPINWKWVSKPLGSGSLSQKVMFKRMWITANVPTGSTLNVYLSKSAAGDTDWQLVNSVVAHSMLESTRIFIPTTVVANANYVRVKFEGTGYVEIKEFARDEEALNIY